MRRRSMGQRAGRARRAGGGVLRASAAVAVLGLVAGASTLAGSQPASAATRPLTQTQWQRAIAQVPSSGSGCYDASYPSLQWQPVACKTGPRVLQGPATGAAATAPRMTVGSGTDYSALVTGTISSATGSFDGVSPTTTETGEFNNTPGETRPNTYSLQLNSAPFTTPECSGSPTPSKCRGWQQFIYNSFTDDIEIQYWLLTYGSTTCPAPFTEFTVNGDKDCVTTSSFGGFGVTRTATRITAPELATTKLTGRAAAGGNDSVSLTFGGKAALVTNPDNILDLAQGWNTAEFGVFGDGGGSEANFGPHTTLDAQTTLTDDSDAAPSCVPEGFTGETNNLTLTATPAITTQGLPTIVSKQTDTAPTTPSCASAAGSQAATTLSTSLSGGGATGTNVSVPAGTPVTDQATLSGTNAAQATGSVTYDVYSSSACTDLVSAGSAEPLTATGAVPASAPVTLDGIGTYYWQASYSGSTYDAASTGSCGAETETVTADAATSGPGYWEVASDGGLFAFTAPFKGSMGGTPLNAPVVGMAKDDVTGGYWEVASDGGLFAFTAPFYGSMGGTPLNAPIVGMAALPTGKGYYEVASDGGIFAFGTAAFKGSMGGKPLNEPVVGMAFDPTTGGYWEVASDGGLFAFTAPFKGSMGGKPLNEPVVGMAYDPATGGYWEVASDGGLFAFTAPFKGSMGGKPLDKPVVGMAFDPATGGYWEVASDGGLFTFTAPFYGSMGGKPLNKPVVGMAAV